MKHILYTEDEGGAFKYYSKHTDEETVAEFNKIIKERKFEFRTGYKVVRISPSYIVLVEDVDGYDFVANSGRMGKVYYGRPVAKENEKA